MIAERYPAARGYPLTRIKRVTAADDLSGTSATRLSTYSSNAWGDVAHYNLRDLGISNPRIAFVIASGMDAPREVGNSLRGTIDIGCI